MYNKVTSIPPSGRVQTAAADEAPGDSHPPPPVLALPPSLTSRAPGSGRLAGFMKDGFTVTTSCCGVKLEGVDDLILVADLTDEASLAAQVAPVHVAGGKLQGGLEETPKRSIRDLLQVPHAVRMSAVQEVIALVQAGAELLQRSAATGHQVLAQQPQLLPAAADLAHGLGVLIKPLIQALEVEDWLVMEHFQEV